MSHDKPFTTAFHTRFPDYASVRTGVSAERFWPIMRLFHKPSRAVMVATAGLRDELAGRGIKHTHLWSRGVDTALFNSQNAPHPHIAVLPRPIFLSVGRVSTEKNLDAFLRTSVPGTKIVVGDGPMLDELQAKYPDAYFMGAMQGEELASAYAAADVFVFPSKTDTFGLVMVEALASGVPVAGYPVSGPIDVIGETGRGPNADLSAPVGALNLDLARAMTKALAAGRSAAADYGRSFSWQNCTDQFEDALRAASQIRVLEVWP